MRIEEIRLTWFFGAALEARLTLGGKSAIVYGPNASGKSAFTDSIEYLLGEGRSRIAHLQHEHSGYRQEKGLRNTHILDGHYTQIEIHFQEDQSVKIMIHP